MPDTVERVVRALTGLRGITDIPIMLTGLSKSETAVLGYMSGQEASACDPKDSEITGTQLAKHLALSQAGVSQIISGLERKGYVRRVPGQKDRRVVRLELTEEGRRLGKYMHQHFKDFVSCVLAGLSPADSETFASLLEKISDMAQEVIANVRESCEHAPCRAAVCVKEDVCGNT